MSVQLPKQVHISPTALFRRLETEGVVLNLTDENYYGLDETSVRMWELLSESGDPNAVVTAMLAEYDVDEETLRRDLAKILDDMVRAKLITVDL
jgi:hypothetical protein